MKLSEKQKKFAEEYLIDFNATRAAIAAGYSKRSAKELGYKLVNKSSLQTYLKSLFDGIRERNKVEIDELVQELAQIVRIDPIDLFYDNGDVKPLEEIPIHARKAIKTYHIQEYNYQDGSTCTKRKIELYSKLDAIEKLMKYLGGYEKDNKPRELTIRIEEKLIQSPADLERLEES